MEQKRSGDTDALSDGSPKGKSRKTEPKANPKCDVIDKCTGAESDSDRQPCDKWGLVYLKRDASGKEELSPNNSPHLMRALIEKVLEMR